MNVWIVAQGYPPINTIGAERARKFVRYFVEKNFLVTVFTISVPEGYATEHSGDWVSSEKVCVRRSPLLSSAYHFKSKDRASTISRWTIQTACRVLTYAFDDNGWNWFPGLWKDLKAASAQERKPDLIVCTGRPFLTFFALVRFCQGNGIPLVLDYRDAWARNPHFNKRFFLQSVAFRLFERYLNRRASLVTTVSCGTARALSSEKAPKVIYNFPDQDYCDELRRINSDSMQAARQKALTLVFAGTLYPGRSLDPLLAAISSLRASEQEMLEIHYAGSSSVQAKLEIESYGLSSRFFDHGFVSKADATALVATADITLSVVYSKHGSSANSERGVITTKIFDYLILKKEILNIAPNNFEIKDIIQKYNLSSVKTFCPSDTEGIADFLREKISLKTAVSHKIDNDSQIKALISALDDQLSNALKEILVF